MPDSGERMQQLVQQARTGLFSLVFGVVVGVSLAVMAMPLPVEASSGLSVDLRTDIGWETGHFLFFSDDFDKALLSVTDQTLPLTILTHNVVPHRCMFDYSQDYCDDRGHPDSWARMPEPVICSSLSSASRALLPKTLADRNQLCVTLLGDFSYPVGGAGSPPDLASHYRARIGKPGAGENPDVVVLAATLSMDSEQGLYRLSPGCYGSVCMGDTLSSVQATTKVPLEILPGSGECGRFRSDRWPVGLTAQFKNSRIARLDVTPPSAIRTDTGFALGEWPTLYETYESGLEETLDAGPGSLPVKATYWKKRNKKGLQFFFNSENALVKISAGGQSLLMDWPCP